jgi:hypothetical protein
MRRDNKIYENSGNRIDKIRSFWRGKKGISHTIGYLEEITFANSFSKILASYLKPMLTKVSYSQDGSDTNSVGTPDYPSGIPDMHTIHDPMISVSW